MQDSSKTYNFIEFSNKFRDEIEDSITFHTQYLCNEILSKGSTISGLSLEGLLRTYMNGGKLWRSSLVLYWNYLYLGDEDFQVYYKKYISLAVSMEFLQAFLLIHDDIMDGDDTRRDMPSMHCNFSSMLQKQSHISEQERKKGGESLAICLGDILYSYSFEIISKFSAVECESNNGIKIHELMYQFARSVSLVGIGQMTDVYWSYVNTSDTKTNISPDAILTMYEQKTGEYTFVLPSLLGLFSAQTHIKHFTNDFNNNNDITQEKKYLEKLGKIMGVMFQIQDDIIGAKFSQDITGKPQGTDFIEKKYTFLWSLLLSKSSEIDTDILLKLWNNPIGKNEVAIILKYIDTYNILQEIESTQKLRLQEAHLLIDKLSINISGKTVLKEFLDIIITRKK